MFAAKKTASVLYRQTPKLIRSFSAEYTKQFLMPSAKRLVALNHLDASKIVGTGLGGRIMGYDVEKYMEGHKNEKKVRNATATPKTVPTNSQVNYVEEPVEASRKARLDMDQQIKQQIPHIYMNGVTKMAPLKSFIDLVAKTANVSLSTTDFAVKAVANSLLREFPLKSVNVNVCVGIDYTGSTCFTIRGRFERKSGGISITHYVQRKNLLDIHNEIEDSKKAASSAPSAPLSGDITVSVVNAVECAGGILSSPTELGSLTLGEPYMAMVVNDDIEEEENGEESVEEDVEVKMPSIKACAQSNYNFSFNGLKLDEVKGQAILRSFKSFVENPEFLME